MTAATWTFTCDAIARTSAALGIANIRRTRSSQAPDVVTFTAPRQLDAEPLFAYGATVTIHRNADLWFTGRILSLPVTASDTAEDHAYRLVGPWEYLQRRNYQQDWQAWSDAGGSLETTPKTRVILCQGLDESDEIERINSGEQIGEILDYAIDAGAPITKGTIDPAIEIPWDEQVDLSCADAIIKLLRWSPDVVTWFDYSTAAPTLHVRTRANLETLTLAIPDAASSLSVTPRYDLRIPGVIIRYERRTTNNGTAYLSVENESAGDDTAYDALITTIELGGASASFTANEIETAAFPADLNDEDWWFQNVPALLEANLDPTITGAKRQKWDPSTEAWVDCSTAEKAAMPRYLVRGSVAEWQSESERPERVIASLAGTEIINAYDSGVVGKINQQAVEFEIVATDASTGTYHSLSSGENAEPTPTGLAAALYATWSHLEYDGQLTLTQRECPGDAHPGKALRITGGPAAWATMDTMIQTVTEDIFSGRTSVTFGPPRHLGPADLKSLLTAFRRRNPAYNYTAREDGQLSGLVTSPSARAAKDAAIGLPELELSILSKRTAGSPTHQIELDPSAFTTNGYIPCTVTEGGVKVVKAGWPRWSTVT